MTKFISYLRVSTQRQGRSGLGLEAQREAVAAHIRSIGDSAKVIREYVEVESGKRDDRPQLEAALKECKRTGAVFLVAKLDRLSRNAAFLLTLKGNLERLGLKFIAADMPDANEMTIGIMAVVAHGESKAISERTKAALAAAKRRGVKLGGRRPGSGWHGRNQRLGAAAVSATADAFAADLRDVLEDIGPGSLRHIAAELARRDIRTPRGGTWTAAAVLRLQERLRTAA